LGAAGPTGRSTREPNWRTRDAADREFFRSLDGEDDGLPESSRRSQGEIFTNTVDLNTPEPAGSQQICMLPEVSDQQRQYTEVSLTERMLAKAATPQVLAIVRNPQNRVKADELKWTDV